MQETQGWQQVVLPWLQSQIHNSWVDPKAFKTNDEFLRAYNLAFSFAQIAQQILDKIEQDVKESQMLTKKENGELAPKSIN